ncbi:MAG: hypothetical protein K0R18_371 [Bacillales bacterium]|jgi:hypothetical protein|nr:hypothetical protein [Bacillales bacterium]
METTKRKYRYFDIMVNGQRNYSFDVPADDESNTSYIQGMATIEKIRNIEGYDAIEISAEEAAKDKQRLW